MNEQILTTAQVRAAEQALIASSTTVDALMQLAGQGAAEWIWRLSAGRRVTVLAGPGNNGGDGWVIAEALRLRGTDVAVIGARPATEAAGTARTLYGGAVLDPGAERRGEVLVDCLFGTGLARPLSEDHAALLARFAASHDRRVAVDLPSGIDSDSGRPLNPGLPDYELTIALGAWKPAHFLMPACAAMGELRLVDIGLGTVDGAARLIERPHLSVPPRAAHKYSRGLLGIAAGAMPGAALLAARAAQGAGAGYVKLFADTELPTTPDLVVDRSALAEVLADSRIDALLIGPGLGRDAAARERLATALSAPVPTVIDADALMLIDPWHVDARHAESRVLTPHEGELAALERSFGLEGSGSKIDRAATLARECGSVVVVKGADTVVASSDGAVALSPGASSWLSTAGSGDVLAGIIASRLATGAAPFKAACQGVWLHGEAARLCGPAFAAATLAARVPAATAACL